jgi:ADP-ribose pyrophosphatase YjhB (NUDIX family)
MPTPGDDSLLEAGPEPVVRLVRWQPDIDPDDPDDGYKHAVAGSALVDPVDTLRAASANLGIPVGALARHVLAEWASAGSAAILEAGPGVIDDLARAADAVDEAPQGLARDEAWSALRGRIQWLAHGVRDPASTYPQGGGGTLKRRRVGAYGLAVEDGHVLLCRVAEGYPGAQRWTLPGGGLEHGEHPHDGLVREVLEETGLRATIREFLLTDSNHLRTSDRDLHLLRLVWHVDVPSGIEPHVVEEDGSTDTAAWIDPERLQQLPMLSVATKALEAAGLRAPRPDRRGGAV